MYMMFFGSGNGFFGRAKASVGASLYFYEDDTVFQAADDVYFSITAAEISLQNLVTLSLEIFRGDILTLAAQVNSSVFHPILSF